jgi:hypothetical protein
MPQKLTLHQNLQIINMYRDGWRPKAIQRKLDLMGNLGQFHFSPFDE